MKDFRAALFVAGMQKAGTTTLFRYLAQHPRLLPPARKETHFFDGESIDWGDPDYENFYLLYANDAQDRIAFDCTPIYTFWRPLLPRIARYNPDAKIIMIFRDPIERAWSHWRMTRRRGAESLGFSAAIREGVERMRNLDPLDPARRVQSYVERGYHASQVRRALEIFPRRNMLFLAFDNPASSHMRVLGDISAFLGIEPFPDIASRHDHAGGEDGHVMNIADVEYLRGLYMPEMQEFSELTGVSVDRWLTMRG